MPAGQKKGFTLIELLVVIAIIAILAAILFPVYTKAQQAARKSQCSSNMSQIYKAYTLYRDDWQLVGMPVRHGRMMWDQVNDGQYGWAQTLWQYNKTFEIFKCPAHPQINMVYSMNQNIRGNKIPKRPSKYIMFFECPGSGTGDVIVSPSNPNYLSDELRIRWGDFNTNSGQSEVDVHGGEGHRMDPSIPYDELDPDDHIKNYWMKDFTNTSMPREEYNRREAQYRRLFFPGPHGGQCNLCAYDGHIIGASDFQGPQFWTLEK